MKLLMSGAEIEAGFTGWKDRRRRDEHGEWCITASEVAQLMGITPDEWGGPYSLYWEKIDGIGGPSRKTMERGRYLEPWVVYEFEQAYPGLHVTPGGLYASESHPWALATFDRLAHDRRDCGVAEHLIPVEPDATVQCKTSGGRFSEAVPVYYRAQVLWEMWVAQVRRAYVPTTYLPGWETRTLFLEWDAECDGEIAVMVREAEMFRERLANGDPPPPDHRPATRAVLARRYASLDEGGQSAVPKRLAGQWEAARKAEAAAKKRNDKLTNLMLERMGDAEYATVRDEGAPGGYRRVARHQISPRAGYTVQPKKEIHSLRVTTPRKQNGET